MKHFLLCAILLLSLSSCLNDYDTANGKITSIQVGKASCETNNGFPTATTDSIARKLFALQIKFAYQTNLADIYYDANESSAIVENRIDSVRITSNQNFAGTPVGQSINEHFYVFEKTLADTYRLKDQSGVRTTNRSSYPFNDVIYFICDGNPASGNYTFFTQFYLHDGSIVSDTILNTVLK